MGNAKSSHKKKQNAEKKSFKKCTKHDKPRKKKNQTICWQNDVFGLLRSAPGPATAPTTRKLPKNDKKMTAENRNDKKIQNQTKNDE